MKNSFCKSQQRYAIIGKFQTLLPRKALLTIHKSFIRPHFEYGKVKYDQSYNSPLQAKLESYQYEAALAMTGAIKGPSTEKFYQELEIEHFRSRVGLENHVFSTK